MNYDRGQNSFIGAYASSIAGLFGTHLSEVFAYTSAEMKYVPRVVYETAEFIRQHGLTADGIFR